MVVPFEVCFLYKICFTSLSKNWKNNNKSHFSTFTPAVCLLFWQYWCDQTLGAVAFCQDWVETNGEGFMSVIIWYSITANTLPSASFYNKSSNKFLEITEKRLSALPSNVNVVIMIGDTFCGSALVNYGHGHYSSPPRTRKIFGTVSRVRGGLPPFHVITSCSSPGCSKWSENLLSCESLYLPMCAYIVIFKYKCSSFFN